MVIAISYGNEDYQQSLNFNLWTAKKIGRADTILKYGPNDISKEFFELNKNILSASKGAGYWLWKPYIVLDALKKVKDNDYIVYADSGSFYIRKIEFLIKQMEDNHSPVFLCELENYEGHYSKRDAFVLLDVENKKIEWSKQIEAAFFIIKKTPITLRFVEDWLKYGCDERIITEQDNVCGKPNFEGFVDNRYDQTIFSLLSKKYGFCSFRNANKSDPRFTCIEPLSLLRKGKFDKNRNGIFREQMYDAWKNKNKVFFPQVIVRTRMRNMNTLLFTVKIVEKCFVYFYRNSISYILTKVYIMIHKE